MPWVEGATLGNWMDEAARQGGAARLRRMADRWITLVADLQANRIAHGDLQHGNVMVVDDDRPVLVDYDGLCVPLLVGRPPLEVGLPAYQHPLRRRQALSTDLDHFSAWIILIALRAVAADPGLWRRFVLEVDNENLLFAETDIINSFSSPLWPALAASPDPKVRAWSTRLRESIGRPFDTIPPFRFTAPPDLRTLATARSPRDWEAIWRSAQSERRREKHQHPTWPRSSTSRGAASAPATGFEVP